MSRERHEPHPGSGEGGGVPLRPEGGQCQGGTGESPEVPEWAPGNGGAMAGRRLSTVAPSLSADFSEELRSARRRVNVLEEANRAIQESVDRITRLSVFSGQLDRSLTITDVGDLLFEELQTILPAEVMLLALVDPAEHSFRPFRVAPPAAAPAAQREMEAQIASGMFGWAVGLRRPTMVAAAQAGSTLILVPLATVRRTVGMLQVATHLPADRVEQRHLTLAAVLARQAAECIDNLWLAEDIRREHEARQRGAEDAAKRRLADLGLLVETANSLSATLEQEEALRFLVEATCRHLEVATVALSILEPDGRLKSVASVGVRGECLSASGMPACDGCPLEGVVRQREALVIPRVAEDPGAKGCALMQAGNVASFLGVPLVARDRVIGVLSVMTDIPREFRAEESALLTGLAAQGGIAIENARLFTDVQDRVRQQQQALARLVQTAHLASVGLLAGGVAHAINNPLCIISNHLQLLRLRREPLPPGVETALASIEASVGRIAGSIDTLLEYAQVRPGERKPTDFTEVVRRILVLLHYHPLCRRMSIVTDLESDLPAVNLDRAAWEQLILELVTNAREAMGEGGRVRICTRRLVAIPGMVSPDPGLEWVEMAIEDDGCGISSEDLPRVFDPFFSTKASSRGMGLGLKICRDIVEEHGGRLFVESDDRQGTRVVIHLPCATSQCNTEVPASAPESEGRRQGTDRRDAQSRA